MGQEEFEHLRGFFFRFGQEIVPGLHVRLVVFHAGGNEAPDASLGGVDLSQEGADGPQLAGAGVGLVLMAEIEVGGNRFKQLSGALPAFVKGPVIRHRDQLFADHAVGVAVPIAIIFRQGSLEFAVGRLARVKSAQRQSGAQQFAPSGLEPGQGAVQFIVLQTLFRLPGGHRLSFEGWGRGRRCRRGWTLRLNWRPA